MDEKKAATRRAANARYRARIMRDPEFKEKKRLEDNTRRARKRETVRASDQYWGLFARLPPPPI
jgi:hypothetical protein